ncbi:MAG: proteasome subunit beta [Actinomycetota bacterium]
MGGPIGANPSFFDLVARERPEALPRAAAEGVEIPHGTTVLGIWFAGGVIIAGDRRATSGFSIEDDRMEKVFAADEYSAIAIAGAAGQAIELVKLFQLELEHYEKITGDRVSLEGKANRLGQMIRGNFPLAMQGLIVVPLFGGFDEMRREGRLFHYDATGGRWEEDDYVATGSGGRPAKSSLKKRWRPGLSREEAVQVAVEALLDASQEDAATGGPDPTRGIFPTMQIVTAEGAHQGDENEIRAAYEAVVGGREGR